MQRKKNNMRIEQNLKQQNILCVCMFFLHNFSKLSLVIIWKTRSYYLVACVCVFVLFFWFILTAYFFLLHSNKKECLHSSLHQNSPDQLISISKHNWNRLYRNFLSGINLIAFNISAHNPLQICFFQIVFVHSFRFLYRSLCLCIDVSVVVYLVSRCKRNGFRF